MRTTKSSKTKKQSAKKTKRKSAARDDDQDGEELSEDEDGPTAAKKVKKSTGGKRTKKASATGTKSKVGGSKTKAKNGKGKAVLVKDGDMEISDDNGLFSECHTDRKQVEAIRYCKRADEMPLFSRSQTPFSTQTLRSFRCSRSG